MEYTEFKTGQRVRRTNNGVEGRIIQLFRPTGSPIPSFKVKMDDGREYCAPVNEWEPCDEPIRQPDTLVLAEHVIVIEEPAAAGPEALARHLSELLEKSFGGEAHGSR